MAARKFRTELTDAWREKIRVSMLLNRLMNHALGKVKMSSTQIRAAEIALRKALPDLATVAWTGSQDNAVPENLYELTDEQLMKIITSSKKSLIN